MSTEALNDILEYAADMRHPKAMAAAKELLAIEKAADGLGQRLRDAPWDQQAWDDGLDLMEKIRMERKR